MSYKALQGLGQPAPAAPQPFDMQAMLQAFAQMFQTANADRTALQRDLLIPKHNTNLMSDDAWARTFGGPREGLQGLGPEQVASRAGAGMGTNLGLRPPPMPTPGPNPLQQPFGLDVAAMAPLGPGGMPLESPDVLLRRNKQMAKPGGMMPYRSPRWM